MTATDASGHEPLRLHIGGKQPKEGWKILNIQAGEHVDFVGSCTDLTQFEDASVSEVYASHVLEHLGYQHELPHCLSEIYRILAPDGRLLVSVPNLDMLCRMFTAPDATFEQRFHLMRIMMGGQIDDFDFHKVGFDYKILVHYAARAGFQRVQKVKNFDLFEDTSRLVVFGHPISLNLVLFKAGAADGEPTTPA